MRPRTEDLTAEAQRYGVPASAGGTFAASIARGSLAAEEKGWPKEAKEDEKGEMKEVVADLRFVPSAELRSTGGPPAAPVGAPSKRLLGDSEPRP
jgi:hypothetical protein